ASGGQPLGLRPLRPLERSLPARGTASVRRTKKESCKNIVKVNSFIELLTLSSSSRFLIFASLVSFSSDAMRDLILASSVLSTVTSCVFFSASSYLKRG